ncbi:DnaB Replicative DNA helicase [uncultured Caudovirales phage]|uniref:DNA helicase/primase n=1 Tax=uncultured Caudovirales phage TaxID=2100421 RepID=A0A6J5KQ31_9CAUD|nr:DnaB Replicative DNA helicase [uncultured Caudovirales phage]
MQDVKPKRTGALSLEGECIDLPARGLREDTCRFWSYRFGDVGGKSAHIAYYLDDHRKPVAAKVRYADKSFTWLGDASQAGLYGRWLWPTGGKQVVVVEGELDALAYSQLQQNKWPVVSIQNGAQGAVKSCKKDFEWLDSFESIIFMMDMDEPGQKAAKECAELFEPGKAKIAHLPLKDVNECLIKGRGEAVIKAMWDARIFRPDGILCGEDLWDKISDDTVAASIPYPWEGLNEKTHGIRMSELVTLTAGSGTGKSAVVKELAFSLIQRGATVGMIMLEESVKSTAYGLMSLHLNKRLHISQEGVPKSDLKEAFDVTLGTGRVYLYDHFGSTKVDHLLSRIRTLAKSYDCKYIFLDHLSILVSSMEETGGSGGLDERRLLDRTMTLLRTLVQETGIALFVVSHLKRPEGKGHENGAQTSLSQLRGSHSIAQLSDMVIGLERNQQGDNPNETVLRVLKNRFSGETGEAGSLFYDKDTGRLTDVPSIDSEF